tara:strand:+ start:9249 stop:9653 length:405 start_codon:yes stop_codon:yes gene_type:complete
LFPKKLFNQKTEKLIKYLVAGGFNTGLGYTIGVSFLFLLQDIFITPVIGILSSGVSITCNYFIYKYFVFKTKDKVTWEIIRFFKVYGVSTLIGVSVLTLCFDYLELSIPISQAISMCAAISISAVGNFVFTFKN